MENTLVIYAESNLYDVFHLHVWPGIYIAYSDNYWQQFHNADQ